MSYIVKFDEEKNVWAVEVGGLTLTYFEIEAEADKYAKDLNVYAS